MMDGSRMTPDPITAFYSHTRDVFLPLTRADMQNRARLTEREANQALAKLGMSRLAKREGSDQTPGSGIYALTPKGIERALMMLDCVKKTASSGK